MEAHLLAYLHSSDRKNKFCDVILKSISSLNPRKNKSLKFTKYLYNKNPLAQTRFPPVISPARLAEL